VSDRNAAEYTRHAGTLGAACGHCALAAWLDVPLVIACHTGFEMDGTRLVRPWVNMPDMEAAFRKCEVSARSVGYTLPRNGLALIQWQGPWTRPGVPPRVACMHRHWIAVRGKSVWDINLEFWESLKAWEAFVCRELMPEKATGWTVARGYELAR